MDTEFKFYVRPYFLRLHLPGAVVEDGRETCVYDIDLGIFTIKIPKLNQGEVFEGLDLLTTLLAKRKNNKNEKLSQMASPLIEVIDDADPGAIVEGHRGNQSEFEAAGRGLTGFHDGSLLHSSRNFDELDWEMDQEVPTAVPELSLDGKVMYGFDEKYTAVLGKLAGEIPVRISA